MARMWKWSYITRLAELHGSRISQMVLCTLAKHYVPAKAISQMELTLW